MTAAIDAIPLTVLERAECFRRLHATAPDGGAVARSLAARMGVTLRSVQHELQIAMCLAKDVRDAIRGTRFANRKVELIALARLRPALQRRVVEVLLNGSATTVRAALELAA